MADNEKKRRGRQVEERWLGKLVSKGGEGMNRVGKK